MNSTARRSIAGLIAAVTDPATREALEAVLEEMRGIVDADIDSQRLREVMGVLGERGGTLGNPADRVGAALDELERERDAAKEQATTALAAALEMQTKHEACCEALKDAMRDAVENADERAAALARATRAEAERDKLIDVVRDVADDVLGLQPADAPPNVLVHAIGNEVQSQRIRATNAERAHRAEGAAAERARIVAWLRDVDDFAGDAAKNYADRIAAGEHVEAGDG